MHTSLPFSTGPFDFSADTLAKEATRMQEKMRAGLDTLREVGDIGYGATPKEEVWSDGKVVLYRADRMHDGAIAIEPRYTHVDPDGGWAEVCSQLELVNVGGDPLAIIDEPIVARVAEHLRTLLADSGSR